MNVSVSQILRPSIGDISFKKGGREPNPPSISRRTPPRPNGSAAPLNSRAGAGFTKEDDSHGNRLRCYSSSPNSKTHIFVSRTGGNVRVWKVGGRQRGFKEPAPARMFMRTNDTVGQTRIQASPAYLRHVNR